MGTLGFSLAVSSLLLGSERKQQLTHQSETELHDDYICIREQKNNMNNAFHSSLEMRQIKHNMRQHVMPHCSSLPSHCGTEKCFSTLSSAPVNM